MNLADQLNQLADDVDTRGLPDAQEIRRTGDRFRRQRRARISVATTVVAVVAIVTTAAVVTRPWTRSAPEPVSPIDGWRVTRTLEIPGSGAMLYGADSLWVVDMKDGELAEDGTAPAGSLYQIDPASGEVLDRIPGAVGGWPSVGGGAIWLCTAAGDLNMLTRVDLATHQVTQIETSHPKQLPRGTAFAGGNLWVSNWVSGDLLRIDPETDRVQRTLHLGEGSSPRTPSNPISDGHSLWLSSGSGLITRLDGATGEQTSRLQLPDLDVQLAGIDSRRHILYGYPVRGWTTLYEINADPSARDQLGRDVGLTPKRLDATILAFAVGSGSLWAATMNPDELVRIDPKTFTVTGRMPLTGMDRGSNVPVALAASGQTVWIRVAGKVLELAPDP